MSLKSWASIALVALILSSKWLLVDCSNNNPTPNPQPYPGRLDPIAGQWTAYGTGTGAGFIQRLSNPFNIPTPNVSVNYVYTALRSWSPVSGILAIGQTLTLNYSVNGMAIFGTVDGGTPSVRLFIWQQNDQGGTTFRWWCGPTPLTVNPVGGFQSLSCALDPAIWTDVNGQNNAAGFQAAISNPYAIGFTFGGQFAGHGVWVTNGSATFKVNSFSVQ